MKEGSLFLLVCLNVQCHVICGVAQHSTVGREGSLLDGAGLAGAPFI